MTQAGGKSEKNFLSGVFLLSVSTVSVKVIGLFYKIPMLAVLGSAGMGYFNSAYEIYALFCVIATAGLPVALSVLISGALARGEGESVARIWRAGCVLFLAAGAVGSVGMALGAKAFCGWIKSPDAYGAILAISPTVLLICLSAALRGYFQGFQRMVPTAVSQVIEAAGKLGFGLWFAAAALRAGKDTPTVAACAGLGLTAGTALSCVYLLFCKGFFSPKLPPDGERPDSSTRKRGRESLLFRLTALSVPMTVGASLVSLTKLIDMAMILRRLQATGLDPAAANAAYGGYTTLALSVYGLLPSLINSVALPLVPMLSSAIEAGDTEKTRESVRLCYRLTALLSFPASLGIAAFSRQILSLLFPSSPSEVASAAPLLSLLGVPIFLSCMITSTNAVLHAFRAVRLPVLSFAAGAAAKIVTGYFLIGNPEIAMLGAPVSTLCCNAVVVFCNLCFLSRVSPETEVRGVFARPLLSAILSVGGAVAAERFLFRACCSDALSGILSILVCAALYLPVSCVCGALTPEDFTFLPGGERLLCLLKPKNGEKRKKVPQNPKKNEKNTCIPGRNMVK